MNKSEHTHIKSRKNINRAEFVKVYKSGIQIKEVASRFGISEMTVRRLRNDYNLPLRETTSEKPVMYIPNQEQKTVRIRKCCSVCGSTKIVKNKKVKGKQGFYKCEACAHEFRSPALKEIAVKKIPLPKNLAIAIEKQTH